MTRPTEFALLALSSVLAACSLAGCGKAALAQETKDPMGGTRAGIDLTIYSQDFALVTERRPFDLKQGANRLHIGDVSKQLDPSSVLFSWSGEAASQPHVSSNTYDLGVNSGTALLDRYLGQEVEMVWYGQDGREGKRVKGTLEVSSGGQMVIRSEGNFLVNPTGTIVAASKPDIVTIPQLGVEVESPAAQKTDLDVSYLTRGLGWSADYVATLDPDSDHMKLECWATVTNLTGVNYPGAKITLVAGSPNRSVDSGRPARLKLGGTTELWSKSERRDEETRSPALMNASQAATPMGELYAYPIKVPATITQDQMNRVRMMYSNEVPIKKDYSVRLPRLSSWGVYDGYGDNNGPMHLSAQLAISFKNVKTSGLGIPMPKGSIRIYDKQDAQPVRFVGAAGIEDTPNEGKADLTLSDVFDVSVDYVVKSMKKVAKNTVVVSVEVKLHNQKSVAVPLRLVQDISEKWKIVSESSKSGKVSSSVNQWKIMIPAKGDETLKFQVRFGR